MSPGARGDFPPRDAGGQTRFSRQKSPYKLSGRSRERAGPTPLPGSGGVGAAAFPGTGTGSPRSRIVPGSFCLLGQSQRFWLKGFTPRWLN